jgi:hypothetical protein
LGSGGTKWDSNDTISMARMNQKTIDVGATEPATMYAGMIWYDSTNNIFKERNAANDAWLIQINQALLTTSGPTFDHLHLTTGSLYLFGIGEITNDVGNDSLVIGTYDYASTKDLWLKTDKVWIGGTLDTNLYRSAANILRTDDSFEATSVLANQLGMITGTNAFSNFWTVANTQIGIHTYRDEVAGSYNIEWFNYLDINSKDLHWYNSALGTYAMHLSIAGQLQLPVTGSTGGLVIGGDAIIYRIGGGILASDGLWYMVGAAATSNKYSARVTGDAVSRFIMQADGKITWGDGTNAGDTNLYRSAAGSLKTDGIFTVGGGFYTNDTWSSYRANHGDWSIALFTSGHAFPYLVITDEGILQWSNGTDANDVTLYRAGADVLRTDDMLQVNGTYLYTNTIILDVANQDCSLYRHAANILRTDDSLEIAVDLTVEGNVYFTNLPASDDLNDLEIIKNIPIKSDGLLDLSNIHERFRNGNVNGIIGLLLGSIKKLTAEIEELKKQVND